MEVRATNIKHTIGSTISSLIVITALYLTIRLIGHAKAGGVLFMSVLFMDLIAIFILSVLSLTKVLRTRLFWIFTFVIILSLVGYFVFHQSYDSYNENRRVLWGLNGE